MHYSRFWTVDFNVSHVLLNSSSLRSASRWSEEEVTEGQGPLSICSPGYVMAARVQDIEHPEVPGVSAQGRPVRPTGTMCIVGNLGKMGPSVPRDACSNLSTSVHTVRGNPWTIAVRVSSNIHHACGSTLFASATPSRSLDTVGLLGAAFLVRQSRD